MIRRLLNRVKSLARNQDGVAAVEFALIAPAFFGLLLAVIDVGRYMWVLNTMQYAIDEAVRAGVIRELTNDQIEDRVVEALTPINSGNVDVVVESDASSVTVTASSDYTFFFPISVAVSGATIDLRTEMPL
ncbi:MAG: TadE/TadG family type IV pilus assembly protein [Candidatus Binataceae bacterium]